jgi:large subunit ribosomal protein L21
MYAIIADGGRQYKVQEGQELLLDYRDVPQGETLRFEKVLAVSGANGLKVGAPVVQGVSVTAEVVGVRLGDKVVIRKFNRRKRYRRKVGHRQMYTRVKVRTIDGVERPAPESREAPDEGQE